MALPDVSTMLAVEYPRSDGQPVAESDFQLHPFLYAVEALQAYFHDQPDVYVSGNIFIYYQRGNPAASASPDVFVVFGVPKRQRHSYFLWEEQRAPAFILEITSRSTRRKDQENNPPLYASWGVQEYWQYDPTGDYLTPPLQGQQLAGGRYQPMPTRLHTDGTRVGVSAVLGLELHLTPEGLRFYDPATGRRLANYQEVVVARDEAEARWQATERARQEAETRWQEAEAARQELLAQVAAMQARLRQATDLNG